MLNKLIARKNRYAGVIVASLAAPVVNTGIFVVGAFLMSGAIEGVMSATEVTGVSLTYYVIIGLAGVNFLIEFAINAVASPAIYRVAEIVKRMRGGVREEAVLSEEAASKREEVPAGNKGVPEK